MFNIKEIYEKLYKIIWLLPFFLGLAYCYHNYNSKENIEDRENKENRSRQFISTAKLVQAACNPVGCPKVPEGWREAPSCIDKGKNEIDLFGDRKIYCATLRITTSWSYLYLTDTESFFMSWHYASDSGLKAIGGVKHLLEVRKFYQAGEKFGSYDTAIFREENEP